MISPLLLATRGEGALVAGARLPPSVHPAVEANMTAHIRQLPAALLARAMVLSASCAPQLPATQPPTATSKPVPTVVPPTPTFVAGLANSPEQILGTWECPGWGFMRFAAEGTFTQADKRQKLDTQPFAVHKFWFTRTQLLIAQVSVHGVPSCGPAPATYQVQLLTPDSLLMIVVKDACDPRAKETEGEYTRVK